MTATPTIDAVVGGTIRLCRPPASLVARLKRVLTFPNPLYARTAAFAHSVRALDGVERDITCLDHYGEDVVVPRGAARRVVELAAADGHAVRWIDQRAAGLPLHAPGTVDLRPYQSAAVAELVASCDGVWEAPCGAGKTVTACAAIAAIGRNALVVVHTSDLLEQWRGAIRTFLGIEAGTYANGQAKGTDAPIVVAMVQSLIALPEPTLDAVGAHFGTVVVDEAHHAPADTFRTLLRYMAGRHRIGLTATPEREDGLTPLLELCIGPTVARTSRQALIAAGYLREVEILRVDTPFQYRYRAMPAPPDAADFASAAELAKARRVHRQRIMRTRGAEDNKMAEALTTDPVRNGLIVDRVVADVGAGLHVLVLTGRKAHVEILALLLGQRGIEVQVLTGAVKPKVRAAILEDMRAGKARCVVGTAQLADEGLDAPPLERLHICFPFKAKGRTDQRRGRLSRPHPGKQPPILIDYVDPDVVLPIVDTRGNVRERQPLVEQWNARRKVYEADT